MKSLLVLCALVCVVVEARPKWQFLPPVPGYVPVYIRNGDTPLEEINPELAEAFHALPAGRSAGKILDAALEIPDDVEESQNSFIDRRPYEKKILEKKKKVISEVTKRNEQR